jgi:hypothetical protein
LPYYPLAIDVFASYETSKREFFIREYLEESGGTLFQDIIPRILWCD